jgi:hypothetical protein
MTGKDFIKILLCSYGYDRNIKVETYNGDYGAPGYEVEADHENGDHFHCIDCEGLMFTVYEILDYMKQNDVPFKSEWWTISMKTVIDDKKREELVNGWFKDSREYTTYCNKMRPCWAWEKEHKPCPICQDNDHAIEFDGGVHYHCSGSYYMNCKKLLQWHEDCRKHREEFRKENGI